LERFRCRAEAGVVLAEPHSPKRVRNWATWVPPRIMLFVVWMHGLHEAMAVIETKHTMTPVAHCVALPGMKSTGSPVSNSRRTHWVR